MKKEDGPDDVVGPFVREGIISLAAIPLMAIFISFGLDAKISFLICFVVIMPIVIFSRRSVRRTGDRSSKDRSG
jgi:hypothetical protein